MQHEPIKISRERTDGNYVPTGYSPQQRIEVNKRLELYIEQVERFGKITWWPRNTTKPVEQMICEIYQDANSMWRWHIKTLDNRIIIASTRSYTRRYGAQRAANKKLKHDIRY